MLNHAKVTRLLKKYWYPWLERRHQRQWFDKHLKELLVGIREYGRDGVHRTTLDLPGSDVDHLIKLLHAKGYSVRVTGRSSAGYHLIICYEG